MKKKPEILKRETVAQSRFFSIEQIDLRFSNNELRQYERIPRAKHHNGAVLIVPVLDKDHFLLVREYAAGVDDYTLAFPKGLVDMGETAEQAANRELKEEVGYGAKTLTRLKTMTLAPGYFGHSIQVFVAEDLYAEKLVGDEPEELEVVSWPFENYDKLLMQEDFHEARSVAALYMAKDFLSQ
ncbi:ADP compounds hydrolase NudE [Piscirickettsia salmonis]|uniref:ADP compounds hydrolase NudE n=1 Tax=Piscirickettsia salmonis TaxID=1238 RepID=UPI0007C8DF73|nr:ADP compounds hydrolase NudE [Piscirickettsiaceae bacterium NZ-RLO1]